MDIIAHSFKYALHDRYDLKVIREVKLKIIWGHKSEKFYI